MKRITEVNNFIESMGTATKIPIIYTQSDQVSIEQNGTVVESKVRYTKSEDVIFQCPKCKDLIGKGKITGEQEDKVKIYCFNCNQYNNYEQSLNNQTEPLWHKPQVLEQRKQFEQEIQKLINKNIKVI